VVRVDLYQVDPKGIRAPEAWDSLLSGTKAFEDLEQARREAARMNALNGPKGCRYVVVTLRGPPPVPPGKR
jgi:hypothetical protein